MTIAHNFRKMGQHFHLPVVRLAMLSKLNADADLVPLVGNP